jgi:hypothetical protein
MMKYQKRVLVDLITLIKRREDE